MKFGSGLRQLKKKIDNFNFNLNQPLLFYQALKMSEIHFSRKRHLKIVFNDQSILNLFNKLNFLIIILKLIVTNLCLLD